MRHIKLAIALLVGLLLVSSAYAWRGGIVPAGGSSSLANGTYMIASGSSAIDGSYGWAGQTPRVQINQFDNFGQQWVWNGSRFSNTTVAGGGGSIPSTDSFLSDNNDGTVTETTPGDTWAVTLVSGSTYRVLNNRTGSYLSLVSGVLAMSATQTAWSIAPQFIQNITLSNTSFTPSIANGTVGTVAVNMIPSSPAFSGSRSITGTNSGGFHLSGTTLQQSASGGTPAGTYTNTNIVATQAGIPNSPQQITPTLTGSSGGGGGTPPASAVAAGFTTLISEDDFSTSTYVTPSNWLDCAGASGSNIRWWLVFDLGMDCPTVVTDPVYGGQVLRLRLSGNSAGHAAFGGGIANSAFGGCGATNAKCFPATSFYMEGESRSDFASGSAFFNAVWAAGGFSGCTMEWDAFETYNDGYVYSDGGFHYCGGSTKFLWEGSDAPNPPNAPPGYNPTEYHNYAMRVTTNGTNVIYYCAYIDGIPQNNPRTGTPCMTLVDGEADVTTASITNPEQISTNISMGSGVPDFNGTFHEYFKNARVWSCTNHASSTAAGGCATSNPNP